MSSKRYQGTALSDDAEYAISGEICLEDHVLRFNGETTVVDLPYDGLELDIQTGKPGSVEVANQDHSDWSILIEGHEILADHTLRGKTPIRRQIEAFEDRKDGFKRLASTLIFFTAFIGLSALLGVMVDAAMPKMVNLISPAYEKEIAMEVAEEVGDMWDEYDDTNTVAKLHAIVDRIFPPEKRGEYEFKISLIDSDVPNAMALPAGRVYVFTGLLAIVKSTEEVAGVLAHEIAHVMGRHGLRAMIANAGPSVVFDRVLGSSKGFLGALAAGSQLLIQQNFSREFESEADDRAFDYLVAANIDPRGLETFLNRLAASEGDMGALRSVLSHPPSPERVAHLKKRWLGMKTQPDFVPLEELGFEPPERQNLIEKLMDL
ncbi:MAG: M48 family metallopeptidase [Verrucomicrobiae bacterium]|nr:M48 family metallopeptidase [Verrucomicrobiae bacterium]